MSVYIMLHMALNKGTQPRAGEQMFTIRAPRDLRRRLKTVCAEEGKSYAELLEMLLDERDAKLARRKAQQNHPLAAGSRKLQA
ncbi:ribbon-helix-helix DNA binding domain protein [Gordonia phage Evaa]|nr:ribbon-helix-helix DNA binding domain protein [Gordonia phage Evaa]